MSIEKYDSSSWEVEHIPYTSLPNNVLQNFTESADALALWAHLMSLPKDWSVNKKYIMNKFKWGKDKTEKTLSSLKKNNLLEHKTLRHEDGKIDKVIIVIKNGSKFMCDNLIHYPENTGTREMPQPVVSGCGYQPPTNTNIKDINTNNKDIQKAQPKKQVALAVDPIVLPDWLPSETWEEFKQHRKQIKKPMSDLAQKKSIKILDKLRSEGQDIIQVIDQSIAHGWQGFFEVKSQGASHGKDSKYIGKNGKFDATQYLLDSIREDEERKLRESQEDNRLFENSLPSEDGQYLQYDTTSRFGY
jgi:hypothetical protein